MNADDDITANRDDERQVVHMGSVGDDDYDDTPVDGEDQDQDQNQETSSSLDPSEAKTRPRLAGVLLLGATAAWGTFAFFHCQPDQSVPPAAVSTEASRATSAKPPAPKPAPVKPQTTPPTSSEGPRVDTPKSTPEWAKDLTVPDVVRYTIRRGGSLRNVANLFKIYHHEILALNPGIELDANLSPNTKVVVYRRASGVASESIGTPSAGSVTGAVPMLEGPGRRNLGIPWKTWATAATVAVLDQVLDRWARIGTNVQPILVGDLSSRTGGRLEPHGTHQSGRDVDLGYPQKLAPGAELTWQFMTAANFDAKGTWMLLKLLVDTGSVEEVYVDRGVQKLLYDYALAHDTVPEASLSKWLEYPRGTGAAGALIRHVPGHTDHLHVRFSCPAGQSRCRSPD